MFETKKPNREYFWKDSGIGESGDIFKLIQIRYGLSSIREAYLKVDYDFQLGFSKNEPPKENKLILNVLENRKPACKISIKSKEFTSADYGFWASFGITAKTLQKYRVKSLQYYWLYEFQTDPYVPKNLAYAFEVLKHYKIYQPFIPGFKFRNNLHEQCLEGFAQLTYTTDTLIITKATKDIMLLDELGIEAVSPRSENTPVPDQFLKHFYKKYKNILVLFDNDMKHRGDLYQAPKIYVPTESGTKDISDFRKRYGHKETKDLLQKLIYE